MSLLSSQDYDLDFLRFLAYTLSASGEYPPFELSRRLAADEVLRFWSELAQDMARGRVTRPLGLYLHVPFCATRCLFCFCTARAAGGRGELEDYARRLLREIDSFTEAMRPVRFSTLFFGGGTPSLLGEDLLEALLGRIFRAFRFEEGLQVTFEATAASLSRRKLRLLRRYGVDRLTIGVQSLSPRVMAANDRVQDQAMVSRAISEARAEGISHVNVDVLAGLPGETLSSFVRGLDSLLAMGPDLVHLAAFQINERTRFEQEKRSYGQEERAACFRMLGLGRSLLGRRGYRLMEEDAYGARGGSLKAAINRQEHDEVHRGGSILGLGDGAISRAFARACYGTSDGPAPFSPEHFGSEMDLEDEMRKYAIENIYRGLDLDEFERIFGARFGRVFSRQVGFLARLGLYEEDGRRARLKAGSTAENFVFTKVFFSDRVLAGLRRRHSRDFNPEEDHLGIIRERFGGFEA